MQSANPLQSTFSTIWAFSALIAIFSTLAGCDARPNRHSSETEAPVSPMAAGRLVGRESSSIVADADPPMAPPRSSRLEPAGQQKSYIPNGIDTDHRPPILSVQLQDHTAYGVPIGLFSDQTLLMRNDGSIQRIMNKAILRQSVLKDRFQSIDGSTLAQQLRSEFGKGYSVKKDSPYVIVARPEHMENWAQRFRSLHHAFTLYFATRGITTKEIEFPLVAVVFGSRPEFLRYANNGGLRIPDQCVGFYFSDSNRILLYESAENSSEETLATICHESAHQLAFNMGLHQRRASTPLWLIEGLATMFESPMLAGRQSHEGKSLWPASRRAAWDTLSKQPASVQRVLAGLIHNDLAFESDFQSAYSVAWGMSAYLSQRRSTEFGHYLRQVGNRPPFQEYTTAQRVTEFQNAFGRDPQLLTNQIIKFLENLD